MTDEPMLVRVMVSAIGLVLGVMPWFRHVQPARWISSIPMSELSRILFTISGFLFALAAWVDGILCGLATALFLVFLSSVVDHHRHRRSDARNFEEQAAMHPGVFDAPPAMLERGRLPFGDAFRIFDKSTGKEVGRLGREPLDFLIKRYREWEFGDNDIFILRETVEVLEEAGAPSELLDFIDKALGDADSVELRWVSDESVRPD